MIVLAILATIIALGVTVLVVLANGMSDAPSAPFQMGWMIGLAWAIAIAFWIAWNVG